MGDAAADDALHRLLADASPDERAAHLFRLIEQAADACLTLPEMAGQRLPLHHLRLDAEAVRPHAERAHAEHGDHPSWWHAGQSRVKLHKARFRHANLQDAVLSNADLTGADFSDALMRAAQLDGACLEQARFHRTDLTASSFARIQASEADFTDALMEDAQLRHAVLRFARFDGALLEQADLSGADLWGAQLARIEAASAKFRGAVAREACFAGADLSLADLQDCNLQKADFSDANLAGAQLRRADLGGARLDRARLAEADLVQLNLLSCTLTHVRISGAWLERTRLRIDQLGGAIGEEIAGEWAAARQGYLDLEQNFRGLGDADSASWCYRRARRMGKRDQRRIAAQAWRDRDWRAAAVNGIGYASDLFVEFLCDYGDSLPRVLRAYVLVLLGFAGFYGISDSLLRAAPQSGPTHNVWDLIGFSFLEMCTSSTPDLGLKPATRLLYFVGSVQYVIGVVLIGLFGFVLGNRIRR